MICQICNKKIKSKGFSTHITHKHNIGGKLYYDTYLKQDVDGYCITCGKETAFKSLYRGYGKHCSNTCAQLDPITVKKKAATCISRYGTTNVYMSEDIKNKIRKTTFERYGVESVLQLDSTRQKTNLSLSNTCIKQKIHATKYNNIREFEKENNCTLQSTLVKQFGQGWLGINLDKLKLNGHATFIKNKDICKIIDCLSNYKSSFEYNVVNYIKSIYSGEIIVNNKTIIAPLELDIYLPDLNLAIECNGTYWHSLANNFATDYHFNKSVKCDDIGIRLIHIQEHDYVNQLDKVKKLLRSAIVKDSFVVKEYCIKSISNDEVRLFMSQFIDVYNDAQYNYGLFISNKLVQILSIDTDLYNNYTIKNVCPHIYNSGIEYLFDYFRKIHNPTYISSACNFNFYDGSLYENLGFIFTKYGNLEERQMHTSINTIIYGSGFKQFEWT